MAIRDLPVKYVWVHRGGKTYAQRYHHNPLELQTRPDLSPIVERFVTHPDSYSAEYKPPHDLPPRIYPLTAMGDPKQVVQKICETLPLWMFPTRLFRSERFLKATKQLSNWYKFLAGLYTYGTPEEAYHALYTVGQHLLQRGEMALEAEDLWRAVALDFSGLNIFNLTLMDERIGYYNIIYRPSEHALSLKSGEYGVYVKLDFGRAARYARDWLPLIAEIAARQIARQIVRGYAAEQESQPVDWSKDQSIYAHLGYMTHISSALCIPALESRVRAVLESLGKPEIVRFYEQTVLPVCQAHEQWRPGAGELYDKVLRYGDS